jgi:hypothetical protein
LFIFLCCLSFSVFVFLFYAVVFFYFFLFVFVCQASNILIHRLAYDNVRCQARREAAA